MKTSRPLMFATIALSLAPMLAHPAFAATLSPASTPSPGLPQACAMELKTGQPRVRCVVSADRAMAKQPAALGAPVIWDRVITDPATLQSLKQYSA